MGIRRSLPPEYEYIRSIKWVTEVCGMCGRSQIINNRWKGGGTVRGYDGPRAQLPPKPLARIKALDMPICAWCQHKVLRNPLVRIAMRNMIALVQEPCRKKGKKKCKCPPCQVRRDLKEHHANISSL